MTIIKNTQYLSNHDHLCIEKDVLDLFEECFHEGRKSETTPSTLLKALECYCDLTGHNINYLSLSSKEFKQIIFGFAGAILSSSFISINGTSKRRHLNSLVSILKQLAYRIPSIDFASELKKAFDNDKESLIKTWEPTYKSLDDDLLRYWSGWGIESRKGHKHFLMFGSLYRHYDKEFTIQFYERISNFFLRQARPRIGEFNQFAVFLSLHGDEWPPECFQDPIRVSHFFKAFFKWHFLNCYEKKTSLPAQVKSWNSFLSNIDEIFMQPGIWPKPFANGLPRPSERVTLGGHQTRIKVTQDGVVVKDKLLTQVPIHLTDDEAIEILFKKINSDISLAKRWARKQVFSLRRSQLNRIRLAKEGTPLKVGRTGNQTLNADNLNDYCATFEEYGFITDKGLRSRTYGWKNQVDDLAIQFGLPRTNDLFPFMVLLTLEHPEITTTFLKELELYDKRGRLTGFVKLDNHYQLVGYKDRRKKSHSEQKIVLSPRAAVYFRQIIEITAPLRDYLRSNDNDSWRHLFLTAGRGFSTPKSGFIPTFKKAKLKSAPSLHAQLLESFKGLTSMAENELLTFISRLNLSGVRASRGVQIYLETKSVQEMAKALGHASYSSNLLSHYLPEPILAFFQTRWIRIFQKAFICEAMKESPYLMEATKFDSMEELNTFLQNHAIKNIPSHLSEPENIKATESQEQNEESSHVMVSIDSGILSALISLEEAVNTSKNKSNLSAHAIYWAEVSRLIKSEITNGGDPLLKKHLEDALPHIKPESMEKIIYAAA